MKLSSGSFKNRLFLHHGFTDPVAFTFVVTGQTVFIITGIGLVLAGIVKDGVCCFIILIGCLCYFGKDSGRKPVWGFSYDARSVGWGYTELGQQVYNFGWIAGGNISAETVRQVNELLGVDK
jgi:hypothetical protein